MKLDYKTVERNLQKLNKSSEKIVVKAVRAAAMQLVIDSKTKKPYAPFETGKLYLQFLIDKPQFKINNILIRVGASTPYAAQLHEGKPTWNWTLPGSGPKYILSKILAYGDTYIKIQHGVIQKEMGAL